MAEVAGPIRIMLPDFDAWWKAEGLNIETLHFTRIRRIFLQWQEQLSTKRDSHFYVVSTSAETIEKELFQKKRAPDAHLQTKVSGVCRRIIAEVQKKCHSHIERLALRAYQEGLQLWRQFGYPEGVLKNDPDFIRFVKESGLLFELRGYQRTSHQEKMQNPIQIDKDGHPLLLVQGEWKPWSKIKQEITWDPDKTEIVSIKDPQTVWNYFPRNERDPKTFPGGLVPIDRFQQMFPVHRLDESEMATLAERGQKFIEQNGEVDLGQLKPCYFQISTTERTQGIPNTPFFRNLRAQFPRHVAIRIIDADGYVYSPSWKMTRKDYLSVTGPGLPWTFLATADVHVVSGDCEDFRFFDQRHVTTIPMTAQKCQEMIDKATELNQTYLRFNYGRQNCSRFASEMLKHTGYDFSAEFTTTISEALWEMLPNAADIPFMGCMLAKIALLVKQIFAFFAAITPEFMKIGLRWTFKVIVFIPDRILVILRNILIAIPFGALRQTPLREGEKHDGDWSHLGVFDRLIHDWTDIFRHDIGVFYYPGKIIEWQKKQSSTFSLSSEQEGPRMWILPSIESI